MRDSLVQPDPVHRGDLDRPYAELMQVAFTPEGHAGIAYVADVDAGKARPMYAVQVDGPLGQAS